MFMVAPLPAAVVAANTTAGAGQGFLLTPDPREAFVAGGAGDAAIALDLGGVTSVDTFFLGFTNRDAGAAVDVYAGAGDGALIGSATVAHSYRRAPRRHAALLLAAPRVDRYFRIVSRGAGQLVAGVAAVGLSLRPAGFDQDWGRPISDTTAVQRQQLGSFGIDPGVTAGGLEWTMPGLTDDLRDRLYALQLDLGVGGTILVGEDADATPGLNERLHWGLLTKLEPFARQAPGESKWTMQVQDWA